MSGVPEHLYAVVSFEEGDSICQVDGRPMVALCINDPELVRLMGDMAKHLHEHSGKSIALVKFTKPEVIQSFGADA